MTPDIRESALAYLGAHRVLTLATSGPDGVWAAALFYANDAFRLYFLSRPDSRHGRHLAASSDVAATVQEDYEDWAAIKGIQLEGRATRLYGNRADNARRLYTARFPLLADPAKAPPAIAAALAKVAWYELVPRRIFFIDNARGFGHRDEVPVPAPEETAPHE